MTEQLRLPTVLVVSENPTVRFWVKKELEGQFFIIQASNRGEAISAIAAKLDLIIIDEHMKESPPLDLCKDLRTLTQKHLTPIFLITGKLKKQFRDQAKEFGVSTFLSDQLEPAELKLAVQQILQAAASRNKTQGLALSITKMAPFSVNPLKKKIILNDRAVQLFTRAKETHTPVGILLLRCDEQSNNTELSEFLNEILREEDALFPIKNGHLALFLLNTPEEKAHLVATKLQAKIFESLQLKISILFTSVPGNEKNLQALIEKGEELFKKHPENLILHLPHDS
jgi:CheY-like chemotaxis protein